MQTAAGGHWDVLATVPSTRNQDDHPLNGLIRRTPHRDQLQSLLVRAPGGIGHNKPNEDAFIADVDQGTRVLLVDDTFTSGSRLQSAASALRSASADVVAAVVIGRVIRTDWSWTNEEWWTSQRRLVYDFDTCCLE